MRNIALGELRPFLRYARTIEITKDYSYNGIVPYDARMLYVQSGRGILNISDRRYRLAPGTLVCWQPGSKYGFSDIGEPTLRVVMLNFDFYADKSSPTLLIPDRPEDFDCSRIADAASFTENADQTGVFIDRNGFYAESYMRGLMYEYSSKQVYSDSASGAIIAYLAARLSRAMLLGVEYGQSHEEIIAYINTHYSERLTYETLGKVFSYHPNHISRMILRATGLPLHRYLLKIRIERSLTMLGDEGRSVSETAALCGFSDAASFAKRFRTDTGLSPSEVRRRKG